ncbi:MAG: hypothetical protein GY711_19430 [bacterium]|nr:hypothetical protein [bacterium]
MTDNDADSRPSWRDALKIWGPALVVTLVGFALALRYMGAPPPDEVVIATGVPDGGYAAMGEVLAQALRKAGIEPRVLATNGSEENLELLRTGGADIGLVQGGLARPEEPDLAGIASLYLEPLWVFARQPLQRIDELRGMRVELGAEGSGTRRLATELLDRAGVALDPADVASNDPPQALEALATGAADAMLIVSSPRSQTVRGLLETEAPVEPASLARARGIARNLTFLEPIRIEAGAIDLAADLPKAPLDTVAAAATLVGRQELHPAVVALLIEALGPHCAGRGVIEDEGAFPSVALLDVPASLAARRAFERGPSFLFRVLPFQVAAAVDRLKILLLPLVTLLFPLLRIAPPVYRWRIRRRILRWYKRVNDLEKRLRERHATAEERADATADLDRFDSELVSVKVPLSYADELYDLRLHLRMVRADLSEGRGRWATAIRRSTTVRVRDQSAPSRSADAT